MTRPLPESASAVVIGGGVMGCSTLYHLATMGVEGAVLLERDRLTSGTTWHSAAQVRQLRSSRNLTRLIQRSAALYAALETETGQATGWTPTGSLSIATNPDRLTHIRRQAALARAYGVTAEEIDADEVNVHWPLANTHDVLGAVYSPDDGRVDPSGLCEALVRGARAKGAQIHENTPLRRILKRQGRVVGVETDRGDIATDRVVVCGGLWSRQLLLDAGVTAPLLPCEHYYLLTQPMEGITDNLPTLSDHDGHLYIRDQGRGLLVGCFEPGARAIDPAGLGDDFAFGLLDEDWDHFEPMLLNAIHRIPALADAEARTLLNGPESFTPDGSFLLGESAEVRGLFVGCGMNSVGIATGGGAGWALAEWVRNGAAPFHLGEADPGRFHELDNQFQTLAQRAPEVLGKHYEISYPGRQWSSARNQRRGALHELWQQRAAHFGQVFGWERPLYFGAEEPPRLTFGRPPWFDRVAGEVMAAHQQVALFDQSTFGKIRVRGADAQDFLSRVCCNDMTRPAGSVVYTPMLNPRGGYESDLTALRTGDDEYLLYVGSSAINRDLAWLERHLDGARATLENVTEDLAVLGVMGPGSGEILDSLGGSWVRDVGYFRHRQGELAGVPVRVARLSYVGEAGVEVTCRTGDARQLAERLLDAGARAAGLYAQTAMRIEKRYLAWGHDLDGDVSPLEAGLGFSVRPGEGYIGDRALSQRVNAGPTVRMVSLALEDTAVNPLGDEPIYTSEGLTGQATSAAFGHRVGYPVALGYVSVADAVDDRQVWLDIAGRRCPARVSLEPLFDPEGRRPRSVD